MANGLPVLSQRAHPMAALTSVSNVTPASKTLPLPSGGNCLISMATAQLIACHLPDG
jgi:hypothetical protein